MTTYDFIEQRARWGALLKTQLCIVAALVRREMRAHFGESRMGYLWALLEPGLHLAAYLLLFTYVLVRKPGLGTSPMLFFMTGIIPYFLYSKVGIYTSGAVSGNRPLLTLPPVKLHDVIVARTVLEAATYFFVGVIVFSGLYVGGVAAAVPNDALRVMEASGLAILIGVGVGMINLVITAYFHNWMTFFGFLSMPLWFFSGIFYLPEHVPEPFRDYLLYNPLVHIVLIYRMGFYQDFKPALLDTPYAVAFAIVVFAFGLAAVRVARRQILAPV